MPQTGQGVHCSQDTYNGHAGGLSGFHCKYLHSEYEVASYTPSSAVPSQGLPCIQTICTKISLKLEYINGLEFDIMN